MMFMIVHILLLLFVVTYYTNGYKISFNANRLKEAMTNKGNDDSKNNRFVPRGVSSNISNTYIDKPKPITPISKRVSTTSNNKSSRKNIDSSLTPKRQSIFDVCGILGRLDTLEGRLDKLEGRFDNLEGRFDKIDVEFKELKSMLVIFAVFFFVFDQWDKSVMRNDFKAGMTLMREERRQDREEMREERRQDKDEMREERLRDREERLRDREEAKEERLRDKREAKNDMAIMREEMNWYFIASNSISVTSFVVSMVLTDRNDKSLKN